MCVLVRNAGMRVEERRDIFLHIFEKNETHRIFELTKINVSYFTQLIINGKNLEDQTRMLL